MKLRVDAHGVAHGVEIEIMLDRRVRAYRFQMYETEVRQTPRGLYIAPAKLGWSMDITADDLALPREGARS